MKRISFIFCLILLSNNVFSAAGVGSRNISTIILSSGGNIIVEIEGEPVTTNCGAKSRFILDIQSPHFERMYSGILAAQKSSSKVNLYYDGPCVNLAGTEYPKVTVVYLYK